MSEQDTEIKTQNLSPATSSGQESIKKSDIEKSNRNQMQFLQIE